MRKQKFLVQTKDLDHHNHYTFHGLTATELGLEKKLAFKFNRIDAEVSLQPSSIGIRADFSVSYTGEFSCVRCLGAYSRDYDVDMHLNYVEGEDPYLKSDNVEITAHDADKVYYQGPQIDLSIGICEAIILSQPIMHLCRDDCQGLCPVCGVNLNVKECFCKREKAGVFTPELSKDFDNQAKKGRRSSKD